MRLLVRKKRELVAKIGDIHIPNDQSLTNFIQHRYTSVVNASSSTLIAWRPRIDSATIKEVARLGIPTV